MDFEPFINEAKTHVFYAPRDGAGPAGHAHLVRRSVLRCDCKDHTTRGVFVGEWDWEEADNASAQSVIIEEELWECRCGKIPCELVGCVASWKQSCVCVKKECHIVLHEERGEVARIKFGDGSFFDNGVVYNDCTRFLNFETGRVFKVARRRDIEAKARQYHLPCVIVEADYSGYFVKDILKDHLEKMIEDAESGAFATFAPKGAVEAARNETDMANGAVRRMLLGTQLGFSLRGSKLLFKASDSRNHRIEEFEHSGSLRIDKMRVYSFSRNTYAVAFRLRDGSNIVARVDFSNKCTIVIDESEGPFDDAVSVSDIPHSLVFLDD